MKKIAIKILSFVLIFGILCCAGIPVLAAEDYTLVSPYADVVWDGEDAWGAYKGNLHSHSTYSDAETDLATMVKEYYYQGYDFLAEADHGVTGVEWNREPARLPLYAYHALLGNPVAHLTDEEYEGITTGTYPLEDGTVRGDKMVCVTGANELCNLTVSKSHVNGYFLPSCVGNGYGGTENGFEQAVAFVERNGGISHINHPGDFLMSRDDISAVYKEENIKFFGDILLQYDTCMGIEVFNENNNTEPYNRILWDNLLLYCLPYGKNVIGFSNTDAHETNDVDTSFGIYLMPENSVENIRTAMQTGAFFAVTRTLPANDVLGPAKRYDMKNTDTVPPVFTRVETDGHTIRVEMENADSIQWIADGKIIATAQTELNLDDFEGAADFTYVRAEIFGEGGVCLTQAIAIDNGEEKKVFDDTLTLEKFFAKLVEFIKSRLLWVLTERFIIPKL